MAKFVDHATLPHVVSEGCGEIYTGSTLFYNGLECHVTALFADGRIEIEESEGDEREGSDGLVMRVFELSPAEVDGLGV